MLLVSFKLNKKMISVLCGLLGIGLLAVGMTDFFQSRKPDMAVSLKAGDVVVKNYTMTNNEQRLEFIAQFGWEVETEPVEIQEVVVPEEFDAFYLKYNDMQKTQGLDMKHYAGKKVKKFTYQILNYPGSEEEVRLNLLTAEKKVIGGDVCSMTPDGFMHGFRYEE